MTAAAKSLSESASVRSLIDKNALDFALSIQKDKGGIIIIHNHMEGAGGQVFSPGFCCCLKNAGQLQNEDETADNKLIQPVL